MNADQQQTPPLGGGPGDAAAGDAATDGTVPDHGGPSARTAFMETAHGSVRIHALQWSGEEPYVALCHPAAVPLVRLRIQAQCLTSTAFAARMCDCGQQVEAGVREAATRPGTVLIYMPQEGRGHGLLSKVEVMAAMNSGLSLAEAQQRIGRPDGRLSYHRIPPILAYLDHRDPLVLLTGSGGKVEALRRAGVVISGTEPLRT